MENTNNSLRSSEQKEWREFAKQMANTIINSITKISIIKARKSNIELIIFAVIVSGLLITIIYLSGTKGISHETTGTLLGSLMGYTIGRFSMFRSTGSRQMPEE